MSIYYNPLDVRCKSIIGGIKQDEKLNLRFFVRRKIFLLTNYCLS